MQFGCTGTSQLVMVKCAHTDCQRRNSLKEGYCRTHGYLRASQDSGSNGHKNVTNTVEISNDLKLELKKTNAKLESIETGLRYEVNSLNTQVGELMSENGFLKSEVAKLQCKQNSDFFTHDALNQHGRLENFRLHNEKENKNENTLDVVIKACQKIGVQIAAEDVQRCHRLGKPRTNGTNRQIICRLRWYGKKEKIMKNRKLLHPDTNGKSIDEKKKILANAPFITEDMTPFRGKLFRYVKKWNEENDKWDVVTTNYGKIFCKVKNEDKKWVSISNTDDFLRVGIPYDEKFIDEFKNDIFIVT